MLDYQPDAEDLQRRMYLIRHQLGDEVDGVVDNAKRLADWRYYVRMFPWGSLGVAAAVGYLIVPRRLETMSPDKETLERLAKENKLVVTNNPQKEAKTGLAVTAANLVGNMVMRAGIAFAGQQVGKLFGEQAAESTREEVTL